MSPSEVVHIAPRRDIGLTLCMETTYRAGADPEQVALVPIYHWCRSCLAVWKKSHGRSPVFPALEKWQLEKYNAWLKNWREERVAKTVATEMKKSREAPNRPTQRTYFPPKLLTPQEFAKTYPPNKEAKGPSWILQSPTLVAGGESSQ